jgi:hypothetical protein
LLLSPQVGLKGIKLSKLRKRLAAAALAKPDARGLEKAEAKRLAEEKVSHKGIHYLLT